MIPSTLVTVSFVLLSIGTFAQPRHPNAHAHNDYEHARPLLDALDHGFSSVEADIYLVDEGLYVSHNRPKPLARKTLQTVYLDPLDSLIATNPGELRKQPFTLLVDIKSEATRTLRKLIDVMSKYPRIFPVDSPATYCGVLISGNRDYDLILKTEGVFIDGRPGDLGKGYPAEKMPWISDHFGNWMHWNGKDKPEASEVQQVRNLANRVHAEGKKLRLWAIPDREEAWAILLDAGVDLINTDWLAELDQFLRKR